ncbi:MAG TPA: sigma-70 family RNA polymerase sigma factor [Anaeromyxobacteraceae bacterium]|jgi:RNA polymerase sigma-70 factor (ECF subfamily)|nr:sigma-70 family RNA polymerase sigma factor [Anaeromyxobacteraceae bacterium]
MASDPDAALMLAFQNGDERAFRTLFERHGRAMVSFCHHYVRDGARAEELAQDVFLKVHRSAARYQPTARFRTWLYRIAANHCLNELRRGEYAVRREAAPRDGGAAEPLDLDTLPSGGATPEETAMGEALAEAVRGLLARLPEKQRTAFVLCRLEGMSYEEIAEVLETSVSAVKSLLHRATVAAAEALAPWSAPDGAEVRQ